MHFSFYIFGNPSSKFTQYPDDYLASVLESGQSGLIGSRLIIKRELNLFHYIFSECVDADHFIGFCIILNNSQITKPKQLIALCKQLIEQDIVTKGVFLRYNSKGCLYFPVASFSESVQEINRIKESIELAFDRNPDRFGIRETTRIYNGTKTSSTISIDAPDAQILSLTDKYNTVIVDSKEGIESGYLEKMMAGFRKEKERAQAHITELENDVSKWRSKQRNTRWVSILSIVVVVLFLILYFKVINPSEVSKYQTKEFLYYGPIKDKKPNGEGVAFYPANDPDGRRYYIGNFDNGERNDTEAMLYYQSGDYFYGTMTGDKWDKGIFYSTSENAHFVGSFVNNEPADGTWYRHEEAYKVKNGKTVRF